MRSNVKRLLFVIIVLLAPLVYASPTQAQTGQPGFVSIDCPVETPEGYAVECGMVTVPEDHANPGGPTIKLAFAIVHSTNSDPAPDPLLFIAGGPGGRTLDNMSFWLEHLHPVLATRDVVLFDQRGTGHSKAVLECPEIDAGLTDPLVAFGLFGPLTACHDRLIDAGIDLGAYNSVQNANDIAALREALGYEQWNLYGVSYGSRVALTVLRDRSRGVRSVVLDAMTPVEADSLLEDPVHAQSAFQKLFAACQADPVCRAAYPDLEQAYTAVANDLAANPVRLEIANSITGESRSEVLDGVTFHATILGMLGDSDASGVPGLVHEVGVGNYESIVSSIEADWEAESERSTKKSRASIGLQLAVICNEDAPFVAPDEMARMLATYPPNVNFSAALDEAFYEACQVWGLGPADPAENAPVTNHSGVPILILTGEYDAARSPAAVRRAAETLANSTVIEFPGAGHSVVLAGECPLAVMGDFLDDPTLTPDTGCLAGMDTPQFYVTVNPTRPIARAGAVLAGVGGLGVLLYAGIGLGRLVGRGQIPWRVQLRRVGWRPLLLNVALSAALYLAAPALDLPLFYEHSLAQMIAIVGPLLLAVQTALLVAPDDEPGLELLLACPRPFHWLFVERVALVLTGQSLAALVVMAAGAWVLGEDVLMAMGGWIASVLFMSGLAAFVSARSRKATMGVMIALLAWLVLGAMSSQMGEGLLPAVPFDFPFPWPRPLGLLQPLVWMAHPFLRPDSLTLADFYLNRVIVAALSLGLMALAMILLADSERLLLGARAKVRRLDWQSDHVAVSKTALRTRLGAMVRYEMLMSWRRGTLRALLLAILIFPQMFYFLSYVLGSTDGPSAADLAMWPQAARLMGTDDAIMGNVTTLVMIVLLLPLMLAELVPLDRQYRVREIVDTLPITRNVYLAGKLLSVWPAIGIGMALSALLSGLLAWKQNGPFHVGTLAAFWITGLIPLALFSAQMGVMLSAGQPNRRRAILTGLAASVVSLAACFILPVNDFVFAALIRDTFTLEQLTDPLLRAASPSFPDAFSSNTLLRLGGTLVIMVAVWVITARAMQREQN